MAKKKFVSAREAWNSNCKEVEVIKAYGKFKVGDKVLMHNSTSAPLKAKKLVK